VSESNPSVLELRGSSISYFTGKMENYFRIKGIPYRFESMRFPGEVTRNKQVLGLSQMPVVQLPDGRWMTDTTKMIQWFEREYPERPIVPDDPVQAFVCYLLEDWADEWFGRYAINSRWCYPDNVEAIAEGFYANRKGRFQAEGLNPDAQRAAAILIQTIRDDFGLRACLNRGCGPDQSAQVRRDFDTLMRSVATHFSEQPYLLGGAASLGDFTFAGLFKAHIASDPEPRSWIESSVPSLLPRMTQIFEAESSHGQYCPGDVLPETLTPFFHHMHDTYHKFLKASRLALAEREKWCELDLGDGPVPMRALKYSEVSRRHIRTEILRLSNSDRAAVENVLGPLGVLDAYLLPPLSAEPAA